MLHYSNYVSSCEKKPEKKWMYAMMMFFVVAAGCFHGAGQMQIAGGLLVLAALYLRFVYGVARGAIRVGEITAYMLWVLWALLTSPLVMVSGEVFLHNIKIAIQMVAMICACAVLFRMTSKRHWFYVAIIAVSLINLYFVWKGYNITANQRGEKFLDTDYVAGDARLSGILGNSNAMGSVLLTGVWACVMFLGLYDVKKLLIKLGILIPMLSIFSYYIIQTGSRKIMLAIAILIFGWAIWMLPGKNKGTRITIVMIASIVILLVTPIVVGYVMSDPIMGQRFQELFDAGGGNAVVGFKEGNIRWQLIVDGIKFWSQNPICGIGLGQFPLRHWASLYSHSDYIEPLACTGTVGFIFYHASVIIIVKKLLKLLRNNLHAVDLHTVKGMILFIFVNHYFVGFGSPHWSDQLHWVILIFISAECYRLSRQYNGR